MCHNIPCFGCSLEYVIVAAVVDYGAEDCTSEKLSDWFTFLFSTLTSIHVCYRMCTLVCCRSQGYLDDRRTMLIYICLIASFLMFNLFDKLV